LEREFMRNTRDICEIGQLYTCNVQLYEVVKH
jgi:hypothetical protein